MGVRLSGVPDGKIHHQKKKNHGPVIHRKATVQRKTSGFLDSMVLSKGKANYVFLVVYPYELYPPFF